MTLTSRSVAIALHRQRRTPPPPVESHDKGLQGLDDSVRQNCGWPRVQERALGSLSQAFVAYSRLRSRQGLKTGRLRRLADQIPLKACQQFCLWTRYHLAP